MSSALLVILGIVIGVAVAAIGLYIWFAVYFRLK